MYGLVDLEGKDEVVEVVLGEAHPQAPGKLLLKSEIILPMMSLVD